MNTSFWRQQRAAGDQVPASTAFLGSSAARLGTWSWRQVSRDLDAVDLRPAAHTSVTQKLPASSSPDPLDARLAFTTGCGGADQVKRDVGDHVFLTADQAAPADFDEDAAGVEPVGLGSMLGVA